MELKDVLVEIMPVFVRQIYNRKLYEDDDAFLEECFKFIENDIDLNIDSQNLYLLPYSMIKKNEIYYEYFKDKNNKLLKCIKKIIDTERKMNENIKNKNHRIHYRVYKDNVYLEDAENTIRNNFFLYTTNVLEKKTYILSFMLNKMYTYENKKKKNIKTMIVLDRLRQIILFLVKHIVR